ncbi:uncharacterized protein LOC26535489 [Drosophila yakuba]|uniref:Uncharacterized protein n=1 Tax=Drosophila yakuba TaxID=7245 RepID=A0A0R1DW99_DROYA|nr:uncharacterized protein LOC26535489 [Drosophila yakuba]KRJ99363.1 uncharacterized protein Dyak_GE28308 [Drosophila yakuba]
MVEAVMLEASEEEDEEADSEEVEAASDEVALEDGGQDSVVAASVDRAAEALEEDLEVTEATEDMADSHDMVGTLDTREFFRCHCPYLILLPITVATTITTTIITTTADGIRL